VYIVLGGGALDAMEHSDMAMMSLDGVRRTLLMAVSPPEGLGVEERGWKILESLVEEEKGGGLEGMLMGLCVDNCE